jgi:hypothetical protein
MPAPTRPNLKPLVNSQVILIVTVRCHGVAKAVKTIFGLTPHDLRNWPYQPVRTTRVPNGHAGPVNKRRVWGIVQVLMISLEFSSKIS